MKQPIIQPNVPPRTPIPISKVRRKVAK
jgi:hypothetical protein